MKDSSLYNNNSKWGFHPESFLLGGVLSTKHEVVLSDFGLAVVQRTLDSLSTQSPAGTPLYMAPEQIQRKPCAASDQYALGVMVYEWLCGEPPFRGSLFEVFSQHLHEPPPSLRARLPQLPPAVEDAVFGALAKDPQHRFPTVQDFTTVLEEAFFATQPLSLPGPVEHEAQEEITRVLARATCGPAPWQSEQEHHEEAMQPRLGTIPPSEPEQQQVQDVSSQPAVHSQTPPKPGKCSVAQTNRQRLLRRVHSFWITGVLEHSLHGAALMALGLEEQPDAVANPWHLVVQHPETTPRPLPTGTRITQVYDAADGELLILGAPGSGKTTLLLELARDLLERAERDEQHPMPVVFTLSSWAMKQQPLVDWLVEELVSKYQIPRKLGQTLIDADQILLLLDGLDEVTPKSRTACIEAINSYREAHGLLPLVVSSRSADYLAQTTRVLLRNAVAVQPLTQQQVETALRRAGPAFSGLREALHQQQAVRDLATTPLMLSVLLLTYQGSSLEAVTQSGADLEQRVWTDYVARMVQQKGNETRYPLEQTRRWLTWLAQQMRVHQQTIFYAEYLQADWLASNQQRTVTWLSIRVPALVLGVLASFLVSIFMSSPFSPVVLLQMGLLGGFLGICLSQKVGAGTPDVRRLPSASKRASLISCVLLGVLIAASFGLSLDPYYSLGDWVRDGSILGFGSGLSAWIFQVLLFRVPRQRASVPAKPPSLRWRVFAWFNTAAAQRAWQAAAVFGTGIWLSVELSYGLIQGLSAGLIQRLSDGLIYGLIAGLSVGLTALLAGVILDVSTGTLRFAERIHWKWQSLIRPGHLRTSLIAAGGIFLLFGLSVGLFQGLSAGLSHGLSDGLGYGLSAGLIAGLSYWLLLGLYQSMIQEHIEDQDRHQFNQGIRRSLRNGALISLVSASIIAGMGVLSIGLSVGLSVGLSHGLSSGLFVGLRFGLSAGLSAGLSDGLGDYGLSDGLSQGLSVVWILVISGFLLMWAMSGGLTILRHYVIRWLLARARRFPWRAQAFLDDATARILLQRVGGGYRFMHRRLLDFFADAQSVPPEALAGSPSLLQEGQDLQQKGPVPGAE